MKFGSSEAKQLASQIGWEFLGSIFIAAGIYNFAVQAEFPMTGFSGISIILYQLFRIPIGLSTIVMNIPVTILCFRLLGKKFLINSLRCMILSSLMIDYLAPLFPVYTGSRLLAALCTGVLSGIGYAIIYSHNSSTAGADFIVMAVKALKPYLSLGNIVLLFDVGVVMLGGILLRDVDGVIYGIIVSYLFSVVVDKAIYGMNAGKMALIVTTHGQKICDVIDQCCRRGSTVLKAQGGYKGTDKQVVMCACSNKEMYLVQRAIKKADPASFLIVLESNEVHGEGFRMLEIAGDSSEQS